MILQHLSSPFQKSQSIGGDTDPGVLFMDQYQHSTQLMDDSSVRIQEIYILKEVVNSTYL